MESHFYRLAQGMRLSSLGITVIGSATVNQGRLRASAQRAIQFSRSTPGMAVSLAGMSNPAHVAGNLAIRNVPPLTEREYYAIYGR